MKVAISLLILACAVFAVFGVFWAPGAIGCSARWSGSTFDTRYGLIAGCQINPHGRWVPERVYREN